MLPAGVPTVVQPCPCRGSGWAEVPASSWRRRTDLTPSEVPDPHNSGVTWGVVAKEQRIHNHDVSPSARLPATEVGRRPRRSPNRAAMSADALPQEHAREVALQILATAAASNIPGVSFASVTIRREDQT